MDCLLIYLVSISVTDNSDADSSYMLSLFLPVGANGGEWVPPPDSGISVSSPSRLPGKNVWLFNITADPSEKADLSSQHPEVVDQLIEKLAMYYKSSVPSNFPDQTLSADPTLHNDLWEPWQ